MTHFPHPPLGASVEPHGTRFTVYSEHADRIELCLLHPDGSETRHDASTLPGWVHSVFVPGVGVGQRYGFRAHGRFAPSEGLRFNPRKLALDPYARRVEGGDPLGPLASVRREGGALVPDLQDSARYAPRAVVTSEPFDWRDDAPLGTSWERTVLYEAHVRSATRRHPGVPEALRGAYLGLASDAFVAHLLGLGVTALELLPIHAKLTEPAVARRGLVNHWGYSTLGFFAPEPSYASEPGRELYEVREMVRRLHRAGIEVILDVVFNHTCEGPADGPAVSFRCLDDAVYYRHKADGTYLDQTGCGNTLRVEHPQVLALVLDSLRYWVTHVHVDGFRFDLASALGRVRGTFDRSAPFFQAIHQDPVLSRVKLIAEPWDVAEGGYQLGNFPPLWAEWNGKFRDTVRAFFLGRPGAIPDLGFRLTGSSDLFEDDGRRPHHSVNFVTAHDGFTLRDLVSYERKHNEQNGEGNRDGTDDNRSHNFGVEGESDEPAVLGLRARQARSLLAILLLSPGVPMLLAGDDLRHTQRGNNNAYCHDDALTWLDWSDTSLVPWISRLLELRRDHEVFRRQHFYRGRGGGAPELLWFRPDGTEMTSPDWVSPERAALQFVMLERTGESFLWMLNGGPGDVDFFLPPVLALPEISRRGRARRTPRTAFPLFEVLVDSTQDPLHEAAPLSLRPAAKHHLGRNGVVVLRGRPRPDSLPPGG